ncbi:50S ribosomal protein L6 [Candidatus Parcubacteria bacterium]|nr:MAG: 50S ribosomal protein L6 [Candidatus Parcubacteria bacterium]
MSRLAKKTIAIPGGVKVEEGSGKLTIIGPRGTRELRVLPGAAVRIEGGVVRVTPREEASQARADAGTMWSLIRGGILGVAEGFSKVLEIEGVGYRAAVEGDTLVLHLGYVNPVRVKMPSGIAVTAEKSVIKVSGFDSETVGRIAAKIRAFKKPEPYKGKGIRYQGEVIRRKVGKKAGATAGAQAA